MNTTADDEEEKEIGPSSVPIDLSVQKGTELDENLTYMYASSTLRNNCLRFKFKHLTAILKTTITFPEDVKGEVSEVTFYGRGLRTKATVNLSTGEICNEEKGYIQLSETFKMDNTNSITTYLHILPHTIANWVVTAVVNNTRYYAVLASEVDLNYTLQSGDMYLASGTMAEAFIVELGTADMNDYPMSIGGWESDDDKTQETIANTVVNYVSWNIGIFDLKTVQSELTENRPIWICVEKVAKYLYTLKEKEVTNRLIETPDRNGGSTLKDEPTAGGKAYENEWQMALYAGGDGTNTADAKTYYLASGNLIATKISNSEVAFHIATEKETIAEVEEECYAIPTGIATDLTNGYTACAVGAQWDKFIHGDPTGLMTTLSNTAFNNDYSFTFTPGDTTYDIVAKQLGYSWHIARTTKASSNGKGSDFWAFQNNNTPAMSLGAYYTNQNKNSIIAIGTYTIKAADDTDQDPVSNQFIFPMAGWRSNTTIKDSNKCIRYLGNAYTTTFTLAIFQKISSVYGYDSLHVRPVTE